ncbi:hypothetical protein RB595_007143 [Gaeumannomyces hyphopodioides]
MTTTVRRRREGSFEICEDVPPTEETQMEDEIHVRHHPPENYDDPETETVDQEEDPAAARVREYYRRAHRERQEQEREAENARNQRLRPQDLEREHEEVPEVEEEEEEEEPDGDASDEDVIEDSVQQDMVKLQNAFPGFRDKYRLIKRIGEGTFSTVYKAEDLQYDFYENAWDLDRENEKWAPPPMRNYGLTSPEPQMPRPRRKAKYVAIKKIYVTSSPIRILNELELLFALRECPGVCPLITAFRQHDQVVAILPYFRHADFRDYYKNMTVRDMSIYLRSLFVALVSVHDVNILHRDIKPTNFLYDPETQRGVLVDFGLAEREGTEGSSKRCYCHEEHATRKAKLRHAIAATGNTGAHLGYPKEDRRPSRRANRAGTRGFRAPEVLFKCTEQTPKIDIWSAGVILLTILCKRFPFFNSADDVDAMIEIATIFGQRRMKAAAQLHGCMFETTIPTVGTQGFSLERIVLWSTCRADSDETLTEDEKLACAFLNRCMELDPARRISAREALDHEFLRMAEPPEGGGQDDETNGEDDEIDMIEA